jgi:hypothetical protein
MNARSGGSVNQEEIYAEERAGLISLQTAIGETLDVAGAWGARGLHQALWLPRAGATSLKDTVI